MGRRTKLTAEVQTRIVETLNSGAYLETAAKFAGIAEATLYNWLDRGRRERERCELDGDEVREDEKAFVEFLESVEKARAGSEVRALTLIQKAAMDGTWQAAAWYLERSHPKKWGRFDRHEVSGPDGGALAVSVSADDLESKVRALLEKTPKRANQSKEAKPAAKRAPKKKAAPTVDGPDKQPSDG